MRYVLYVDGELRGMGMETHANIHARYVRAEGLGCTARGRRARSYATNITGDFDGAIYYTYASYHGFLSFSRSSSLLGSGSKVRSRNALPESRRYAGMPQEAREACVAHATRASKTRASYGEQLL